MHFFLGSDVRLFETSEGDVFSTHAGLTRETLSPYLALGEVSVIARRVESPTRYDDDILISGDRTSFIFIPSYSGLGGLLRCLPGIVRSLNTIGSSKNAVIVSRLPEPISVLMAARAICLRQTLVSLIVANAYDLTGGSPFVSRFVGSAWGFLVGRLAANSCAVVFVTREWLQRLFPLPSGTPVFVRSSVLLPCVQADGRTSVRQGGPIRLISVGQMTTLTKGFDTLLSVLSALLDRGFDVELDLVGSGMEIEALKSQACDLGLLDRVVFHGQVNDRGKLFSLMDHADVYVSASRTEGLPRTVIEAMSRGLPAVCTAAGGSGELAHPEMLVPVDDVEGIVKCIARLIGEPQCYREVSRFSLDTAEEIRSSVSVARYIEFLKEHVER